MVRIVFQLITYVSIFTLLCLLNTDVCGCKYGFTNANGRCLECGTRHLRRSKRIVGGTVARKRSWPAQVFIRQNIYDSGTGQMQSADCGGTLIGPTTVLTAAHCIFKFKPNAVFPTLASSFVIVLGAHNISFFRNNEKPPSEVIIAGAKKVIIHKSFSFNNDLNDIAIIKLNRTIQHTDYINYACLPKKSTKFPMAESKVFASGWGTLHEDDFSKPDLLRNVELTVYKPFYCRKVRADTIKNWKSQICADILKAKGLLSETETLRYHENMKLAIQVFTFKGLYNGGKDTCEGDSGGGLMISEQINGIEKFVVSGIISYGEGCAKSHKPGYVLYEKKM